MGFSAMEWEWERIVVEAKPSLGVDLKWVKPSHLEKPLDKEMWPVLKILEKDGWKVADYQLYDYGSGMPLFLTFERLVRKSDGKPHYRVSREKE